MAKNQFRIGLLRDGATRMTCREANCANEANGWVTVLDLADEQHRSAAHWIRTGGERRFYESPSQDALEFLDARADAIGIVVTFELRELLKHTPPGMVVFLFPPGQPCFRPHLDREVLFVHEKGSQRRVHARAEDYIEDFNEESNRVQQQLQRG